MRICEDCLLEKSVKDDFYHHHRTGASSICKSCTVKANRLRRNDPESYRNLLIQRRNNRRLVLIPDHKVCPKCQIDKPLEDFRMKSRGLYGRSSWCRACEGEAHKEYTTGPRRDVVLARRRGQWADIPRSDGQRELASKRARDWYEANKIRALKASRIWVKSHPEEFKAIQKKYLAKNPVHTRRKAYMEKVERTFTHEQWLETLEVFNHCCAYCLCGDVKLTMDHVIPVSKGGPHTQDNIVPACRSCNSKKNNRPIWVMAQM